MKAVLNNNQSSKSYESSCLQKKSVNEHSWNSSQKYMNWWIYYELDRWG
jgi:hypothetical protein